MPMTIKELHVHGKQGFSLVELSIVLVILGLLTGGILGGQALIKAAELRAVSSEFSQWQTAVNTFKDKYQAIPGDMNIATQFWTADSGCGTNGVGGNTTPGYLGGAELNGTCNGNGNAMVSDGLHNGTAAFEQFLFWQHLSLAGLIPGTYTGVRSSASVNHHVLGENAPASKFPQMGWAAVTRDNATTNVWWDATYGNHFTLGAPRGDGLYSGGMLAEDAWNIDTKMDDGKPGTGSVHGFPHTGGCTNAASASDTAAQYQISQTTSLCSLHFRHSF